MLCINRHESWLINDPRIKWGNNNHFTIPTQIGRAKTTGKEQSCHIGRAPPTDNDKASAARNEPDECDNDGKNGGEADCSKLAEEDANGRRLFACPFWKRDPTVHMECLGSKLPRITHVKQHLRRYHKLRPETQCSRCWNEFTDIHSLSIHQRQDNFCEITEFDSETQFTPRSKADKIKSIPDTLPNVERWYRIWDILFPGTPRPESPYINSDVTIIEEDEHQQGIASNFRSGLDKIDDNLWNTQDHAQRTALVEQICVLIQAWLGACTEDGCSHFVAQSGGDGNTGEQSTSQQLETHQASNATGSSHEPTNRKRKQKSSASGDNTEDEDQTPSKRPKVKRTRGQIVAEGFACPFQKRFPEIYGWQTYCHRPWENARRLKEHLYRRHRRPEFIFCNRCSTHFNDEEALVIHQRSPTPCQLAATMAVEAEGINETQEKALKASSRRNDPRTEHEKCRRVYEIIWPGLEKIPCPCWDPITCSRRECTDQLGHFIKQRFCRRMETEMGKHQNLTKSLVTRLAVEAFHELSNQYYVIQGIDAAGPENEGLVSRSPPQSPLVEEHHDLLEGFNFDMQSLRVPLDCNNADFRWLDALPVMSHEYPSQGGLAMDPFFEQ